MSLDISLLQLREVPVFESNITHNLGDMASACGLYQVMWRPEELGIERAEQAIPYLSSGIERLVAERKSLEKLEPSNGWGSWEGLLRVATDYLVACKSFPDARIEASR